MIDLNVRALTELSLAFVDSLARTSRRPPQCRLDGRLSAWPGHGGLLRHQGLRAVVHARRCTASSSRAAYASTVLCPGPVPTEFAERAGLRSGMAPDILTPIGRVRGGGGLSRTDGRARDVVVPGLLNKLVTLC